MILNCNGLPNFILAGFKAMEEYGFLQIGQQGILCTAECGDSIVISKSDKEIHITYDTIPHFYMALARAIAMDEGTCEIEPKVQNLGLMLDCSRNAVPKPEMVKQLICLLALAGYTYLELYTEETYELPDEPYFGYKRGRYRAEELKEIVAFADIFGIEMVPTIQTLGHLSHLDKWNPYIDYMDTDGILLVGDERTYQLIRKSIRFCKEIFHSNRINIGTDEARRLGLGKYLKQNGYRSEQEIYLEHLKKVFEICKEEEVEPEFWADAFYLYGTEWDTEGVKALFDGTQMPIMWNYTSMRKGFYQEHFATLQEYAGTLKYAGAFFKCYSYVPQNTFSECVYDVAFEAIEEYGISDILMTTWGDNGSECSIFATMSPLWYSAASVYSCPADLSRMVKEFTGYTSDEWRGCDRLNLVPPEEIKMCNAAEYNLYNDLLVGLVDYHIRDDAGQSYARLLPEFEELANRNSGFSYIFKSYAALCKVLIKKATYSKRLYQAYQNQDRVVIEALCAELPEIKADLEKFYQAYRQQWMTENKGFGFEVMDIRLGGLIARTDTVALLLRDYLDGKVERIYELEEDRLPFDGKRFWSDGEYALVLNKWYDAYTVNDL